MKAHQQFLWICLGIVFFVSCKNSDSPLQGITGPVNLTKLNIDRIQNHCSGKDTIRFAVLSDTHRWFDKTGAFVRAINLRHDLDFVIHLGDLTNFSLPQEYLSMRDSLLKLLIPHLVIIGNHDMIGSGMLTYRRIYGDTNFSFIAGDTRFLCLNTCVGNLDIVSSVPDFLWLGKVLRDTTPHTRTIALMHIQPGDNQFDNKRKNEFQDSLKRFPGLCFALHGHTHLREIDTPFHDGIIYYGEASIEKRHYFVFTLHPSGYDYREYYF